MSNSSLTNASLWAKGLFVAQVGAAVSVLAGAATDPSLLANWKALAAQAGAAALYGGYMYLKQSPIPTANSAPKTDAPFTSKYVICALCGGKILTTPVKTPVCEPTIPGTVAGK